MQIRMNTRVVLSRLVPAVVMAGLAGGAAEIVWVGACAALGPANAGEVARQITWTVLPAEAATGAAAMGVAIHLALSIALAGAFAVTLYGPAVRRMGVSGLFLAGLGILSVVWALNFLVILPVLNPAFPALLPYAVTFTSKLLFGTAMCGVYSLPALRKVLVAIR